MLLGSVSLVTHKLLRQDLLTLGPSLSLVVTRNRLTGVHQDSWPAHRRKNDKWCLRRNHVVSGSGLPRRNREEGNARLNPRHTTVGHRSRYFADVLHRLWLRVHSWTNCIVAHSMGYSMGTLCHSDDRSPFFAPISSLGKMNCACKVVSIDTQSNSLFSWPKSDVHKRRLRSWLRFKQMEISLTRWSLQNGKKLPWSWLQNARQHQDGAGSFRMVCGVELWQVSQSRHGSNCPEQM